MEDCPMFGNYGEKLFSRLLIKPVATVTEVEAKESVKKGDIP